MKTKVWCSIEFNNKFGDFEFDLTKDKNKRKYVVTCEEAYAIHPLTDQNFYKNMIDANQDKFMSKKEILAKRAANKLAKESATTASTSK